MFFSLRQHSAFKAARFADVSQYQHIDSIKHTPIIKQFTASLIENTGLSTFAACLILMGNRKFILSNHPTELIIPYHTDGIYRTDDFFTLERYDGLDYFFPHEIKYDLIGRHFLALLNNDFNIYYHFGLVRRSPECQLILTVGSNTYEKSSQRSYKSKRKKVEQCFIDFFDAIIEPWSQDHLLIKNSRFYKDTRFRQSFIKGNLPISLTHHLTNKEREILYWVRYGKTTAEIAFILGNKPPTIKIHTKSIKDKLNASNMCQAVAIALQFGLLT